MNLFTEKPEPAPKRKVFKQSDIDGIYQLYPRKQGKKAATTKIHEALKDLLKSGDPDPVTTLKDATSEYRLAVKSWPDSERQFIPLPATWFHQGRYEDDRQHWYKGEKKRPAPASKILNGWELKLQGHKKAILSEANDRQRNLAIADYRGDKSKMTPRLLDDPAIAAVISDIENQI